MLGVELVDPQGNADALGHPLANRELAAKVQRECLKRGLILELGGRHGAVVRFLPPLIISAEQVDEVAQRFTKALIAAV
jgi:diaminobutyrate-2-oxoglutarate transaminase